MRVSRYVLVAIIFVFCCYILVLFNINTYIGNETFNIYLDIYNSNKYNNNHPKHKIKKEPDIDLLIIMIDNRFKLLNNDYNHDNINMTYLSESYYHYSFCINYLYSSHHNYKLLLIDPLTNDSTHACNTIHHKNKNELVPMEWCKLEILNYYLSTMHTFNYKWLLYLDADTHFIKFNTSFTQWLDYIHHQYKHYMPQSMDDIHFLLTNDTPRFIERELPRLQNIMKDVDKKSVNYDCSTYGNAGVLFLRKSNISLAMLDEWSKSINVIPNRMIREFPREQGSLNCFITNKYSKYVRLLPTFTEINIDWFYRDFSFIQHITSANWHWRKQRFQSFLQQLIESNNGNYTEQCQQRIITKCMPSYKNVQLKFIDSLMDNTNDLLLKCVTMKHDIQQRQYGNMNFIEHKFD